MQYEVMIDIEALAKRSGAAIFELAAAAFDMTTGEIVSRYYQRVTPASPFFADPETLEWHTKQGTWPRELDGTEKLIGPALREFADWYAGLGRIDRVWSWGSTYDCPLLETGFLWSGLPTPWKFYEFDDARTVWRLAFPGIKAPKRPHTALEDVEAAIVDLRTAIKALRGS